ncbi:hypothetical protein GDO86_009795 [Hymenochirus boettgeri]|uniref:Glycoprotein endo-alpha-1,2-mannosidase n=1 Tax=Hymenochirus boettgeri TaxID=247094 RepID=A0A8T2JHN1_9PIPI|nr:hypothetical protein GDO86_009795 [Hymenochirus boettgeri]
MIRFRRRTCITLSICIFLVCFIMMGLKMLRPENAAFGNPFGLGLLPGFQQASDSEQISNSKSQKSHTEDNVLIPTKSLSDSNVIVSQLNMETFTTLNYDFHIFYYSWYGNPDFDGKYIHWNHPLLKHWDAKIANNFPEGRHSPPDDIAANFYPELGPYSSRDPSIIDEHMKQIGSASIGVVALSWYPPGMADDNGEPTEKIVPTILEKAHKYGLKVTFHIEPYKNRDDVSLYKNIIYIIDTYGNHPAFYRYKASNGRTLPFFYIYDSYITPPETWANLLTSSGSHSIRNTPYDGIFVALLVEEKHKRDVVKGGFDGFYTYFATNGFSYGSSHNHWASLKDFSDTSNLIFIPSVGPGYIDTSIRPWNFQNTRNRINGKYYETAMNAAVFVRPRIISITSFNEWHEGTQIEAAVPKKNSLIKYEDYLPHKPNIYLELTKKWSKKFIEEKEQWLV